MNRALGLKTHRINNLQSIIWAVQIGIDPINELSVPSPYLLGIHWLSRLVANECPRRRSWRPPQCRGSWPRRGETGPMAKWKLNYVTAWRPTVSKRTPTFITTHIKGQSFHVAKMLYYACLNIYKIQAQEVHKNQPTNWLVRHNKSQKPWNIYCMYIYILLFKTFFSYSYKIDLVSFFFPPWWEGSLRIDSDAKYLLQSVSCVSSMEMSVCSSVCQCALLCYCMAQRCVYIFT